jgi:competence protein ComEA
MRNISQMLCLLTALMLTSGLVRAEPVNINTADAETLAAELDGVGPALAAAIVRDREENGPYESPEDITRVRGIGERVLEDNRENIRVKDDAPAED